jgi:hypothetical protein
MTNTNFQGGSFDLSRVVERTFASIGQNWLVFLVLSVVLVGLPSVVSGYGQSLLVSPSPSFNASLLLMIGGLLTVIGGIILQGTVVFATVSGFNGKPIDVGGALAVGLRFFFPLLGLAILMGLGLFLGFVLLIIPGLILMVVWVVAAPALVIEKLGVMESFQRSRNLTRGNRWMIFALLVIYSVLAGIINVTLTGLGGAMGGAFAAVNTVWLVAMVLTPLVGVLSGVVSAAGVAAIYYELRRVKEGVSSDQLAAVFD